MGKARLEAFSDGVIAILITIILDSRCRQAPISVSADAAGLHQLRPQFCLPWDLLTNHHHMLHATERIDGRTSGRTSTCSSGRRRPVRHQLDGRSLRTAAGGRVRRRAILAGVAYYILLRSLVRTGTTPSAAAVGRDVRAWCRSALYAAAIALAFVSRWISAGIYVLVAMMACSRSADRVPSRD